MPDDRKKMFIKKGTGTVPKIKHRNNTPYINQSDFQRNVSTNNLGLDWQRYDYSNYSRNPERNFYQLNPFQMEASFAEEHRQNGVGQLNMPTASNGPLSTSSASDSNSRRASVGTIPKCDNVKKYPDKKHIEDKLNQIREYLRVTTSLMSSIKNTDDQAAQKERADFEQMIKDLTDSEAKLLILLSNSTSNKNNDCIEEQEVEENHNMDLAVSEHMQKFSQLIDILACQQNKLNNICNTNNGHVENEMDNLSEPGVPSYQRNELEEKVEFTNRKVQLLREQQNALINLKRKAENQLREAQQAQEGLLLLQQQKPKLEQVCCEQNDKNLSVTRFDAAIKELEEKLESMRTSPRRSVQRDNLPPEPEYVNDQLESSNHLLHLLHNQDAQLNSEHMELQQKLNELQSKKLQIDQLAEQLQTLGDDDDEDIGNQVRKIVTMKQQLSSLKDLLEIVKNTEFSLLDSQNVNELDTESQDNAHGIACTKTDNIQQDVRSNRNHNENGIRHDMNAVRTNEQWLEKQSNKSLLSIQEREKVLAELKAKKRELEEIMYKQKDRTSINNDVCSEISINKSDMSANNNMFDGVVMSWLPAHPNQHNQIPSAYSSDDCPEEDINEYSDLNSATEATAGSIAHAQPSVISNYSSGSYNKHRTILEQRLDPSHSADYVRRISPIIPEPCAHTVSSAAFDRERTASNSVSETDNSTLQVQKQLELIHSVCQSLLDQQTSNNMQQLRNNSVYPDPRSYMPLNPRQGSVNGTTEMPPYVNPQLINPQCFGVGDMTNNQNMLAANTLQTQAFLLNTLNQCCQMLWFQQREILTLRNMICTMQEQMINGQLEHDVNIVPPPPSNPYVFQTRPASSLSNFRSPSQPRNVINSKVNQVSAACSLPNLNPSPQHANLESAYMNQNNIRSSPSARLLESSLNNTVPIHSHHEQALANNTVLPNINVNTTSQPLPTQIWNGQALNNQVAPGNRANNYWDNFRSYSRQNLLSTSSKSNEGLQHSATVLERTNTTYDRSHSFSLPPYTTPKLNTVQNESTNTSEESTPRRHVHLKTSQNTSSTNKQSIIGIPPDVLNVNHNAAHQKINERQELINDIPIDLNGPGNNLLVLDMNGAVGGGSRILKGYSSGGVRNRNEWNHENDQSDTLPKSKLFEELRDNVYKEVANLISANESRPHFLIQLFRDLQQIDSDPMRGRTLQSIQTVIANSLSVLESSRGASKQLQSVGAQQTTTEQEIAQVDTENFPLQHSLWSQSPASTSRDSCSTEIENVEDPDVHNILKVTFDFLKCHNNDILHPELTEILKGLIKSSVPFNETFAIEGRTFHKHFLPILNEVLEKYQGRRISEIAKDLLKTISDLLIGEVSFFYLVQESIPENSETLPPNNSNIQLSDILTLNLQKQVNKPPEDGHTPQMQNGDLAEADQSRIELHEEEEGAVGGMVNILGNAAHNIDLVGTDATEVPKIDFPVNVESEIEFAEQGLDQVPTRLSTHSRSNSNTPSRDRSNSSRSDPMEHF